MSNCNVVTAKGGIRVEYAMMMQKTTLYHGERLAICYACCAALLNQWRKRAGCAVRMLLFTTALYASSGIMIHRRACIIVMIVAFADWVKDLARTFSTVRNAWLACLSRSKKAIDVSRTQPNVTAQFVVNTCLPQAIRWSS